MRSPWVQISVRKLRLRSSVAMFSWRVIGPRWLEALDESGVRRLDKPDDFVRLEIEAGLERNILLIPVLIGDAKMPQPDHLPPTLRELSFRNGVTLRHDPDFGRDMERIIRVAKKVRPARRFRRQTAAAVILGLLALSPQQSHTSSNGVDTVINIESPGEVRRDVILPGTPPPMKSRRP